MSAQDKLRPTTVCRVLGSFGVLSSLWGPWVCFGVYGGLGLSEFVPGALGVLPRFGDGGRRGSKGCASSLGAPLSLASQTPRGSEHQNPKPLKS